MIGGRDRAANAQLAEILSDDPEVRLLRNLGNPIAPSLLVVEMFPEHAEVLREWLGPEVTIERDMPLHPFGRGHEIRDPQEGGSP
ncbi:hypothetical protein HII36_37100 [Nonomuraea sp. NN258]|uniref:hypothetical protein n=1 Tax=Nonomuraea antri TaxID=2730852 RepID=UPI001567CF93|nr:hypothetical protein [Nonomuraea antri]NRQ37413.1 hypothetical protein [Nonomuraea antri]